MRFGHPVAVRSNDLLQQTFQLLYKAEMEYNLKERIYGYLQSGMNAAELLGVLQTMELTDAVRGMLSEVLLAETR